MAVVRFQRGRCVMVHMTVEQDLTGSVGHEQNPGITERAAQQLLLELAQADRDDQVAAQQGLGQDRIHAGISQAQWLADKQGHLAIIGVDAQFAPDGVFDSCQVPEKRVLRLRLRPVGHLTQDATRCFVAVRQQVADLVVVGIHVLVAGEGTQQWPLQQPVTLGLVCYQRILLDQVVGGEQLQIRLRGADFGLHLLRQLIQQGIHLLQIVALRVAAQLQIGNTADRHQGPAHQRDQEQQQFPLQTHALPTRRRC